MASNSTPSGSGGRLDLSAVETSTDAVANTSVVHVAVDVVIPGLPTNVGSVDVILLKDGVFYIGTTIGGSGTTVHAIGVDITVAHNTDGTGSVGFTAQLGASGTIGLGGPTSVGLTLPMTTLTVPPLAPTGVTATRISDTQASLAWTNHWAGNGAATSEKIQVQVNGAAWADLVTISPTTSITVTCAGNQKLAYRVVAINSAGSATSAASNVVYTTPAAPTGVTATKSGLDIIVAFTDNVAFTEHEHVVLHGVSVAGVITWDGSPLATVAAGTTSYTHVAPNAAQLHVYAVFARNTDIGALTSSQVQSNTVQLLAAPNKPTLPALPAYVDKASAFMVPWTHNPVDTTAQTAYEFGYSTDGGSSWTTTGKVTSATSSYTIPASTYISGVALTVRSRTWGQATTGGSDGTGASPWSDQQTFTFKTRPTTTILSPANASTYAQSALAVGLSFSQPEGATFVSATIELYQGATLIESVPTTTLASTQLTTRVANGVTYTAKATVRDSNGVVSAQAVSTFDVEYTSPVEAGVAIIYAAPFGFAQLNLSFPAPDLDEVAAVAVTVERTIAGVTETVIDQQPITSSAMSILDMTPTVHGRNVYTIATFSADGASTEVEQTLETTERRWAFLSTGPGFATIIAFWANPELGSDPGRDSALFEAAGRKLSIALFGEQRSLVVSTRVTLTEDSASPEEVEQFLKDATKVCYRDPSGRRVFGIVKGSISDRTPQTATFSFQVSEAT